MDMPANWLKFMRIEGGVTIKGVLGTSRRSSGDRRGSADGADDIWCSGTRHVSGRAKRMFLKRLILLNRSVLDQRGLLVALCDKNLPGKSKIQSRPKVTKKEGSDDKMFFSLLGRPPMGFPLIS